MPVGYRRRSWSRLEEATLLKALTLFALFLAVAFFLAGCTTAQIHDVNAPFLTIRKIVVTNLPQGMREESMNGREYTSGFFSAKNWEDDATDKVERAYAKVLILNSERPYDIVINVFREKKVQGRYESLGKDEKLTKQMVERINDGLADRRDDRNVIDDFRAF